MQNPCHLLLLEDEPDAAELMVAYLEMNGFRVTHLINGKDAWDFIAHDQDPVALAVLDVQVPGLGGREVLAKVRSQGPNPQLPVIFLTALDGEGDEIEGLALGADDYLAKPASLGRLLARIQAQLRRQNPAPEHPPGHQAAPALLVLDADARLCSVQGQWVDLTATEFFVLHLLKQQPSRVFARADILAHLADDPRPVFDRTVDAHIKNLRHKLGPAADCIRTVRGLGYGWNPGFD